MWLQFLSTARSSILKFLAVGGILSLELLTTSFMVAQDFESPSGIGSPNNREGGGVRNISTILPTDWDFQSPSGIGQPGGREGGATRTPANCLINPNDKIALLVPESNYTYTTQEHPSFAWYLPPNRGEKVKFVLYENSNPPSLTSEGDIVYVTDIDLVEPLNSRHHQQGQLMSVSLPTEIGYVLEDNQVYTWEVSLYCSANDIQAISSKASDLEKVSLPSTLINRVESADLQKQLMIYAEFTPYPLWTDILEVMMRLRRQQPNNPEVEEAWMQLLQSAELDQVMPVDP